MPLFHVVILAVVQGITEFLPVSSSGHLVMTWELFDRYGWQVPENTQRERLILDVAVHVGTLFAVGLYFWRDIAQIAFGLTRLLMGQMSPGARLAFHVILGSIPLVVVGYFFRDAITESLRDIRIVAWATIGFAVLLLIADRFGLTVRRVEHLGAAGAGPGGPSGGGRGVGGAGVTTGPNASTAQNLRNVPEPERLSSRNSGNKTP